MLDARLIRLNFREQNPPKTNLHLERILVNLKKYQQFLNNDFKFSTSTFFVRIYDFQCLKYCRNLAMAES